MFHRVLPDPGESYSREMAVSVDVFRELLGWIVDNYEVVSLTECCAGSGARKQCALTFDDGWLDVFVHGVPVMKEAGVRATVFVPTEFIGTRRRFWQERLCFCLAKVNQDGRTTEFAAAARALLPSLGSKQLDYGTLRRALLQQSTVEAEQFVDAVEHQFGMADGKDGRAFMNWEEVSSMYTDGFSFGSHTLNHVLLTKSDHELARAEIHESRSRLEKRLGTAVTTFAYPWGDRNGRVAELVCEAGYECAVTTSETLMPNGCDPLAVPRVFVSDSILCRNGEFDANKLEIHLARLAVRSAFPFSK